MITAQHQGDDSFFLTVGVRTMYHQGLDRFRGRDLEVGAYLFDAVRIRCIH